MGVKVGGVLGGDLSEKFEAGGGPGGESQKTVTIELNIEH